MRRIHFLLCLAIFAPPLAAPAAITLLPEAVSPVVADRQQMQVPDRVELSGWVGQRIRANEANRLVRLDLDRLLEGYVKRPGRQSWEGEHVGKWLHAATLAWANTGDPVLRARLDRTVVTLGQCQLEDGYLGTYVPAERWTEWDVWAHKYNLLGLITYMRYTGNRGPLETCRRMADLLCREFGDKPGQRDIILAGQHVGLAPLSGREPMALLYRFTGEPRYLDFCRYLLRAAEQANGPHLVSTLLASGHVNEVGNGKAYEMLSCLNGLLEMYRTTGEAKLLTAVQRAWTDIEANRLYLTGAASYRELFRADHDLPNCGDVGETCVTVTWLQLNAQLLRLTGEARFADELERVVLNQLLGAQSPDGTAWGYYVQMQSTKPYSSTLTGHCCLSSGPRGIALIPTFASTTDAEGVVVNLYEPGTARFTLPEGGNVLLQTTTGYPADGLIHLVIEPGAPAAFALKLRIPAWAVGAAVAVNGSPQPVRSGADGYLAIRRTWSRGDKIDVMLPLGPRLVVGDQGNTGRAALLYGPLVLAADEALLAGSGTKIGQVMLTSANLAELNFTVEPAPEALRTWPGARVFRVRGGIRQTAGDATTVLAADLRLIPFADAGGTGTAYAVWLPLAGAPPECNVLLEGKVGSTGKTENLRACADGELSTVAILRPEDPAGVHGFSVVLPRAVAVRRLVFAHGQVWGKGGWFDTSAGAPQFEVQRTPEGRWEKVGELPKYPKTTATNGGALGPLVGKSPANWACSAAELAGIIARCTYTLELPEPISVVAVRVSGTPSRPASAEPGVLTCAEFQAFTR